MTRHRLLANAQDPADLPVPLAARRPQHAIALAVGEHRRRRGRDVPARRPEPPRALERERAGERSEEHTSELQSLMRISYAVFCLKKKKQTKNTTRKEIQQ